MPFNPPPSYEIEEQEAPAVVIWIGPLEYTLETVKDLTGSNGVGLFGEIVYDKQIIRLEEIMSPNRARIALWHEVLHGVADLYQLDFADSEQTIATLAMAIVQLLKDNPVLRSGEL
jgi:hypothetical protein